MMVKMYAASAVLVDLGKVQQRLKRQRLQGMGTQARVTTIHERHER